MNYSEAKLIDLHEKYIEMWFRQHEKGEPQTPLTYAAWKELMGFKEDEKHD